MEKDPRQIRTTNNRGLIGYRAKWQGRECVAIMKGKECKECLGILYPENLLDILKSGPYIELDKIYFNAT